MVMLVYQRVDDMKSNPIVILKGCHDYLNLQCWFMFFSLRATHCYCHVFAAHEGSARSRNLL